MKSPQLGSLCFAQQIVWSLEGENVDENKLNIAKIFLAAPPWGAPVCFAKSSRQQFSVSGGGGGGGGVGVGVGFQIRSTVLKLKILYA